MKVFYIVIVLFLVPGSLLAQGERMYYFLDLAAGFGSETSFKLSADIIIREKHSFSLGVYASYETAKKIPSDYNPGTSLLGKGSPPGVFTDLIGVMYGWVWYPGEPQIRIICKGGFVAGRFQYPDNFVPRPPSPPPVLFNFGTRSNYTYEDKTKPVYGIRINPVVEFPTRFVGLSLGGYGMLTTVQQEAGVEVSLLLGKVRRKLNRNQGMKN